MADLKTLDLSGLAPVDEAEITLLHPTTGEPLDIKVTVASADSERYRAGLRAQQDARFAKAAHNPHKPLKLTAGELEAENLDLLVKSTVSWEGVVVDGKPVSCTPENVRSIYQKFRWMYQQLDRAITDRANFMKG